VGNDEEADYPPSSISGQDLGHDPPVGSVEFSASPYANVAIMLIRYILSIAFGHVHSVSIIFLSDCLAKFT